MLLIFLFLTRVCDWSLRAYWLIAAGAYPCFCSMKQLRVFLLPLDGMLVHHRSLLCNLLGFPNNLPVPIQTPGWSEALWDASVVPTNTTQCSWAGLEPRPLPPGTSTITMRPRCLPYLGGYGKYATRVLELASYEFSQVVYFPVKHLYLYNRNSYDQTL